MQYPGAHAPRADAIGERFALGHGKEESKMCTKLRINELEHRARRGNGEETKRFLRKPSSGMPESSWAPK